MNVRAGFVGFGEVNTPREFIEDRCAAVRAELEKRGVEIVDGGIVSDDPDGIQSACAVEALRRGTFDALVVCVAGWIPSWAVFRTIEPFRHLPMLLWGLSGWKRGEVFVTTADQAGTTALRAPMAAMGYNFKYLVNFKDGAPRCAEAADYLRAASASAAMRNSLGGMAGYRDMRLYGTCYNATLLKGALGFEIEHFDLLEIQRIETEIPESEISVAAEKIRSEWTFIKEPRPGTVENSVRLALAFRRKIAERGYGAFSFCDVDGVKKLLEFAPAGALTLLHELSDVVSVPENDSYGLATLLFMKFLTGATPGYLEFYEFTERTALMGVPDYVPGSMVEGGITVMPNAFGAFGEGLLNVSKLRTGVVTLTRLAEIDGRLVVHSVRGTAKTPPRWEEAGWAPPAPRLPSLEVELDVGSEAFLQRVQGQHYVVSYGDRIGLVRDYCAVNGIDWIG